MLKELGLYIHIPFCIKKCSYCDFASFVCSEEVQNKYTDYIMKEIDYVKGYTKNHYLTSVFFGGGTPTLLSIDKIIKIMNKIKASFYIDKEAEISIECNPKTADFSAFLGLKQTGFNRISVGVQTLDEKLLKLIGRAHDLKDFFECYASLKLAGFENINFDLMFGLPEQTFEIFKSSAENILKFNPTHISCYSLTLEENTPLYKTIDKYYTANDEENRKMYHFAKELFQSKGYEQYEISNFAQKDYTCRHNLKYWELKEYIGLGSAAGSFFNNVRYTNPPEIEKYENFIDAYVYPFTDDKRESINDLMGEFMFLGLRKTKGIYDKDFKAMFNKSFFEVYGKIIEKHIKEGLLCSDNEKIWLSERGLDLANTVMCDFV